MSKEVVKAARAALNARREQAWSLVLLLVVVEEEGAGEGEEVEQVGGEECACGLAAAVVMMERHGA